MYSIGVHWEVTEGGNQKRGMTDFWEYNWVYILGTPKRSDGGGLVLSGKGNKFKAFWILTIRRCNIFAVTVEGQRLGLNFYCSAYIFGFLPKV